MSDTKKTTQAKKLVPRLRFPEFQDDPGWSSAPLGTRISLEYGKALPGQRRRAGRYPVVGSNGIVGSHNEAIVDGPVIVIGRKGSVGQITWVTQDCFPIDTTYFTVNKDPRNTSLEFLFSLLSSAGLETLRDPSAVPGLNRRKVELLEMAFPEINEQRKIADCLSSLDELITAERRKLDALKAHKRGLMQRLFPREGESVPRLRFPEFRDAGEWEPRQAGSLFGCRVSAGEPGLELFSVTMNDGLVVRSGLERHVVDIEDPASNKLVLEGDIVYNMMRMWQGASGVAPESCLVSPAYVVLSPKKDVHSQFFGYLFKLPFSLHLFTSHSHGLTKDRLRLYYKDFASIIFYTPTPAEQKRIASVFQVIDEHISLVKGRIEMLYAHKKGLMQQLFPTLEEEA